MRGDGDSARRAGGQWMGAVFLALFLLVAVMGCSRADGRDLERAAMADLAAGLTPRLLDHFPNAEGSRKVAVGIIVNDQLGDMAVALQGAVSRAPGWTLVTRRGSAGDRVIDQEVSRLLASSEKSGWDTLIPLGMQAGYRYLLSGSLVEEKRTRRHLALALDVRMVDLQTGIFHPATEKITRTAPLGLLLWAALFLATMAYLLFLDFVSKRNLLFDHRRYFLIFGMTAWGLLIIGYFMI
ncbi:MAG: hypothetical protein ABIM40_05345 [Pseudomonadota bacterium]